MKRGDADYRIVEAIVGTTADYFRIAGGGLATGLSKVGKLCSDKSRSKLRRYTPWRMRHFMRMSCGVRIRYDWADEGTRFMMVSMARARFSLNVLHRL